VRQDASERRSPVGCTHDGFLKETTMNNAMKSQGKIEDLELNRETIRDLAESEAEIARGGEFGPAGETRGCPIRVVPVFDPGGGGGAGNEYRWTISCLCPG
jgi:hypothetical protein